MRRRAPTTRVVLVASIYNRTGYKRRPTSLYGADDYVEQHHIPDALVGKLERLDRRRRRGRRAAAGAARRRPRARDPRRRRGALSLDRRRARRPTAEDGRARRAAGAADRRRHRALQRRRARRRRRITDTTSSRRGCASISRRGGCSSICACRPRCGARATSSARRSPSCAQAATRRRGDGRMSRSLDEARAGLRSDEEEIRRGAVARLAAPTSAGEAAEALDFLVEAMGDASWRVRKEAAARAAALGDPRARGARRWRRRWPSRRTSGGATPSSRRWWRSARRRCRR